MTQSAGRHIQWLILSVVNPLTFFILNEAAQFFCGHEEVWKVHLVNLCKQRERKPHIMPGRKRLHKWQTGCLSMLNSMCWSWILKSEIVWNQGIMHPIWTGLVASMVIKGSALCAILITRIRGGHQQACPKQTRARRGIQLCLSLPLPLPPSFCLSDHFFKTGWAGNGSLLPFTILSMLPTLPVHLAWTWFKKKTM